MKMIEWYSENTQQNQAINGEYLIVKFPHQQGGDKDERELS